MPLRRLSTISAVLLVAAVAVYGFFAHRFWFMCDDAWISFRYSYNWANGNGVRYNLGDHLPVEGYSNFGWMALAALMEVAGLPLDVVMPATSAICGLVLLLAVFMTLMRLGVTQEAAAAAVLVLAAIPSMGVWATSGLATMPAAMLVFLLFDKLALTDDLDRWKAAAVIGICLALIRTEGVAWVGVIGALALVARSDRSAESGGSKGAWVPVALALWAVGCVYLIYFAWRYATYQAFVANTALVKVGFGPDKLNRGFDYVVSYYLALLVPLVLFIGVVAAVRRFGGRGVAISLMAIAFPIYAVVVGGDYMTMGRLLVPGLPFGAALLGIWLDGRWTGRGGVTVVCGLTAVLVALAVLPSFNVNLVPAGTREAFHFRGNKEMMVSEYEQWEKMKKNALRWVIRGKALALTHPPEHAFVAAAVGAVGYHSHLFIYDRNGLVTREVALLPEDSEELDSSPGHDKTVPRGFFLKYRPELLLAKVMDDTAKGTVSDFVSQWDVSAWTRQNYVPDFQSVDVPGTTGDAVLVTLRLTREGESAPRIWAKLPQRLSRLEGGD